MFFLLHLGNNVETNVKWRVTTTKFLRNQSDFYNKSNSSIPTQVHTCVGMDHLTSNIHCGQLRVPYLSWTGRAGDRSTDFPVGR